MTLTICSNNRCVQCTVIFKHHTLVLYVWALLCICMCLCLSVFAGVWVCLFVCLFFFVRGGLIEILVLIIIIISLQQITFHILSISNQLFVMFCYDTQKNSWTCPEWFNSMHTVTSLPCINYMGISHIRKTEG